MRTAALLMTLALGCSDPGPHLHFAGMGLGENLAVLPIAVKVINEGAAGQVDEVVVHVTNETILGDVNSPDYATSFDANLSLVKPIKLPARQTTKVHAELLWELPDNPPPLVAIISASIALRRNGTTILTTPAYSFVLQSQAGAFDEVMHGVGQHPDRDAEMLRTLNALDAKPSVRVEALRAWLEGLEWLEWTAPRPRI